MECLFFYEINLYKQLHVLFYFRDCFQRIGRRLVYHFYYNMVAHTGEGSHKSIRQEEL